MRTQWHRRTLTLLSLFLAATVLAKAQASQPASGPDARVPEAGNKLTLQQAVALSLQKNPSIHAADAYAEAVRQSVDVAKAGRYPRLDFSEGFTRSNNPVYVFGSLLTQRQFTANDFALNFLNTPPPLDIFHTQFTASVPLYDAGETRHKTRDARISSDISRSMLTLLPSARLMMNSSLPNTRSIGSSPTEPAGAASIFTVIVFVINPAALPIPDSFTRCAAHPVNITTTKIHTTKPTYIVLGKFQY